MVLIIMGVSGSGKSTIGPQLAQELHIPFFDADDFHPPKNVNKMSSGKPLNDEDRQPWLEILSEKISEWNSSGGAVLACSALKKSYRTVLQSKSEDLKFIYLKGSGRLILQRIQKRNDHYMPPELLDSQFEALEEPDKAITVSIESDPKIIVRQILDHLSSV